MYGFYVSLVYVSFSLKRVQPASFFDLVDVCPLQTPEHRRFLQVTRPVLEEQFFSSIGVTGGSDVSRKDEKMG